MNTPSPDLPLTDFPPSPLGEPTPLPPAIEARRPIVSLNYDYCATHDAYVVPELGCYYCRLAETPDAASRPPAPRTAQ